MRFYNTYNLHMHTDSLDADTAHSLFISLQNVIPN